LWSPEAAKKSYKKIKNKIKNNRHLTFTFHPFAGPALRGRFLPFLACGVISPT